MNRKRIGVLAGLLCLMVPLIAGGQLLNLPCRTYGAAGSERCYGLVETPDHGYVLAGWTTSFGADTNILVVRTDSAGLPLTARLTSALSGAAAADKAYSIVRTMDGGYAITGTTRSRGAGTPANGNVFVLRLDPNLNQIWFRVYGTAAYDDGGRSIIQTLDGGFAVAGWVTNTGVSPVQSQVLFLKLDPLGNPMMAYTYGPATGGAYQGYGIAECITGGTAVRYAIVGEGWGLPADTSMRALLLRLDTLGVPQPPVSIMSGPYSDGARSVLHDGEGWVVAGYTRSFLSQRDANLFVSKLGTSYAPAVYWTKVYGWLEGDELVDGDKCLTRATDGLALAGWTRSKGPGAPGRPNFLLLKLTPDSGNIIWSRLHPSIPGANDELAMAIIEKADQSYAAAGYTNSFGLGADDFHFVTLDRAGNRPVCVLDSVPLVDTCAWTADIFVREEPTIIQELMTIINGDVGSTVVCSLSLRDVRPWRILRPTGIIESTQSVVPACSVSNSGTTTESYPVRLRVGNFYDQTVSVTDHAPGTMVYVTWPSLATWPRGRHMVICSTGLASDERPENDMLLDSVTVRIKDVGCLQLIRPVGTIDSGLVVTPACSVHNYGTENATFTVRLRIGTSYNNPQTVVNLMPDSSRYVEFLNWTASAVGTFAETCATELPGDIGPTNDKKGGLLFVRRPGGHDVACIALVSPAGYADSGAPVTPACSVANNGAGTETYTVRMKIGPLYNQQASVFNHAPGTVLYVTFPDWNAEPLGLLAVACSTELSLDDTRDNDQLTGSVQVLRPGGDIALTKIITPASRNTVGVPLIPTCSLYNFGNAPADYWIYMRIGTQYFDSAQVLGHPVASWLVGRLPSWTPAQIGSLNLTAFCNLDGDLYRRNDTAYGTCKVDSGGTIGWAIRRSLPEGPKGKRAKDGACLAYNEEHDSGFVYCLKGNNTVEFYKYVDEAQGWLTKESIPSLGSSLKKKAVKKGGAITGPVLGQSGVLYAVKGNNSLEFWQYTPGVIGVWTQKRDVPAGTRALKEGTGLAAVNLSGTPYVYLLKGSGTNEFYRYNTLTGLWETRKAAPAGASGKPYKNGSCIAYDGANTIYLLKGSYNEFFAYDVNLDSFVARTSLPLTGSAGRKKVKDGAALASSFGTVYALKGGNTNEFWNYDPVLDAWTEAASVPLASGKRVKGGGALVAAPAVLYALKGNNTLDFLMYKPSTISSPPVGPGQEVASQAGFEPRCHELMVAPNPVRELTRVRYSIAAVSRVRLKLYDITGNLVAVLRDGYEAAGVKTLVLPTTALARGVYLLKLEAAAATLTTKLIIE